MQTDAIIFRQKEVAEVGKLEVPPPTENEIQVRSHFSTISAGTEGWIFRNLFTWSPTPFPCVPGYQRAGVVTALGPKAKGWRVGERAMAVIGTWAGKEVESFWGGHVATANVPADFAFHLADKIDDVDASSAVVAQVGYNAASRAAINAGDWVLAYGDGLIGQFAAQSARARGARVIMVGHRRERLELAKKHSADAVVNSKTGDVIKAVRVIIGDEHVTAVLDSVQTVDAQKQYLDLLERGRGQIVYHGFTPGDQWADMGLLQQRELTTHFVSGWTRPRMEATFALMAEGKIKVKPLITHLVPFTRAPQMYEMIVAKNESFLGITFDWKGSER